MKYLARRVVSLFCFFSFTSNLFADSICRLSLGNIVLEEKKLLFDEYPNAYNPSILRVPEGFLLSFRYLPYPLKDPGLSHIGIVLLNSDLEPITKPRLIATRKENSRVQSQSEDARLFAYKGRIYLLYNDNEKVENPGARHRRDMFLMELEKNGTKYLEKSSIKLFCPTRYRKQNWEKNWVPFVWDGKLFMSYTLDPHEVLSVDIESGACLPYICSGCPIDWAYGRIRGGSSPLLVKGEYLAFFHSARLACSDASSGQLIWHYFAGAYTFSKEPPFAITKISKQPLIGQNFYTQSPAMKRVIFPGGAVFEKETLYLAYGKDDCEIWIAKLPYEQLVGSMEPVDMDPVDQ